LINPIEIINGKLIKLLVDNIDTDRIIPARFMKTITFENLGEFCFHDERFDTNGLKKDHPFNNIVNGNDYILLTGKNFGCGSSREHAPQSLKRAGVKAIIAESFAEIFFGNATTIGLPCIELSSSDIELINNITLDNPQTECIINLAKRTVNINNKTFLFDIPEDARTSFLNGTYDSLNVLVKNIDLIKDFERKIPYKII
jgi:3-isopropylmalate/(R)-2-methylmalate dehydratase small subunit